MHREWCDAEILRQIRRKSLAKLRREVEPVEQHTLARFLTHWQGLVAPRRTRMPISTRCLMPLKPCRARLCPLRSSSRPILPARIADYQPAGLDTLIAAGEVAWAGVEPIGERDGRIALFLADKLPLLAQQRPLAEPLTEPEEKLLAVLESSGASFFDPSIRPSAAVIPAKPLKLYGAWSGAASSPTILCTHCAPTLPGPRACARRAACKPGVFRSRRTTPPTAQGRWSLLPLRSSRDASQANPGSQRH